MIFSIRFLFFFIIQTMIASGDVTDQNPSGYSAIFPSGIRVGTIAAHKKQRDDNFYTLEVLLATDFTSLQHVRIINNKRQKEQIEVEQEAKRND